MDKTKNTPQVHPFVRIAMTSMMLLTCLLSLIYLRYLSNGQTSSISFVPDSIDLIMCLPLSYIVWRNLGGEFHSLKAYGTFGGFILGGVGLVIGILIPVLFKSGAQGPLIGFILTGPIGFILGTILGIFYWKKAFSAKQTLSPTDPSGHPKTL